MTPITREEIYGMGRESLLSWIRSKGYGVAEDLFRGNLIARAKEFWDAVVALDVVSRDHRYHEDSLSSLRLSGKEGSV
jgi:hypothetical protein